MDWFLAIAMSFCFALSATAGKMSGTRLPSVEKVFLRSIFNSVATVLWIQWSGSASGTPVPRKALTASDKRLLLVRGLIGCFALWCYMEAATTLPLATASVISRIHPLFGGFFSAVFLGEPWGVSNVLACGVALVGVCMVSAPGEADGYGAFIAALAGVSTGAAFTSVRALNLRGVPEDLIVFSFHLSALMYSALFVGTFVRPNAQELSWLLLLAVTMQLAQMFLTKLLSRNQVAVASQASFLGVVWSTLIGILIGDEFPAMRAWLGCALIYVSVVIMPKAKMPHGSTMAGALQNIYSSPGLRFASMKAE